MKILFEEYHYDKVISHGDDKIELSKVLADAGINAKHVEDDTKLSVDYVGYFYSRQLDDCVFILPKVLINEDGKLSDDKINPNESIDPEELFSIERNTISETSKDEYARKMLDFVYEFSVWVYRAIDVYRHRNPDSDIALSPEIVQMGRGRKRDRYTLLDIMLALVDFNRKNQDYLTFVLRNIHSGNSKINWTKTVAQNKVLVQNGTPFYTSPINKKKRINYDEELLIIYYSILHHIKEKYNFNVHLNANFDLITGKKFEQYVKGMGKRRLKQIKYKYFSDRDLQIWDLCYAFFNQAYKVTIRSNVRDYLLVHDFHAVFEDMVDELLSDKDKEVQDMKTQEDNKRLDHLYRYFGLTEEEKKTFYIGDSKYYPLGAKVSDTAVAKQYTYARNLVQYHMNLYNSDKEDERNKAHIYLDEETEGYDIVPNFFISAKIDDISKDGYKDSKIEHIKHNGKNFLISYHFKNRLYDRDTILVSHYNINFLFLLALYGKNRSSEQQRWAKGVKKEFRKKIIEGLNQEFQFYVMTPREHVNGQEVLQQNFKEIMGKVFKPYPDGKNGQKYYSLALEKPKNIENLKHSKEVEEENKRIDELLEPYFEKIPCNIGEDKRKELTTPPPDGIIYAQEEDLALLITKLGQQYDNAITQLKKTGKVGIALQMDGAVLQLVEGFTKAKYLIIHNKSDRYKVYGFDGKGPKLIPGDQVGDIVTTKQDESLYLVYQVDLRLEFYLGEIDLSVAAKGDESYFPQLWPVSKLVRKQEAENKQ